jgi:Na+-driven multidrug efflux pump
MAATVKPDSPLSSQGKCPTSWATRPVLFLGRRQFRQNKLFSGQTRSVTGRADISAIFGRVPALGPAGAGWGLIVPFGAGSLVLFAYLRSSRSLVTLAFCGVSLQWRLFAEILKVGVPGLINVSITNLSVVLLTGIAGHLGREVAIGYAMGARLEYILIPLAFGFGTTIVAIVGTNRGAKQYRRAREIAWTGAATVAGACATIGLIAALFPALWMGLFTSDEEIVRIGASYLRIVGPIYGFNGLGMALYFATQGFGSVILTVTANAVRLLANATCALVAIFWLDFGAIGFFVAVAMGFCAYAALTVAVMLKVKEPAPELAPQGCGRIASR